MTYRQFHARCSRKDAARRSYWGTFVSTTLSVPELSTVIGLWNRRGQVYRAVATRWQGFMRRPEATPMSLKSVIKVSDFELH